MKVQGSFKFVLLVQVAALVATALDIPIARQIAGFIYVSVLPGFLILRILGSNLESRIFTLLLSVGLSVAFMMFLGLFLNEIYPLLGIAEPLSALPLSITIGASLLIMSLFSYRRDLANAFSPPNIRLLTGFPLFGISILSIVGALLNNSHILLLTMAMIACLVLVAVSSKPANVELHSIVIVIVALSLLFHMEFISSHLVGWDVFGEFYVFRLTEMDSLWNPAISSPFSNLLDYNAMLSVTVLPTVYSNLLNMQGEWVFKVVYTLLYSLVPLLLYHTYEQEFGKSAAFLSAFYFVLFPRFYTEERRQIVGELFLMLLISLILDKNVSPRKKQILLIIFAGALVVSHYSLSYIFMFCIAFAWIFLYIMKKVFSTKRRLRKKQLINANFVVLIIIFNLSWYVFVSISPTESLFRFANSVVTSFTRGFLRLETRGEEVSGFFAQGFNELSLAYKADYIISKVPYIFIMIGFFVLIRRYKEMRIQLEYLPLVIANVSILSMVLLVPGFAPAFLANRFLHISLLFLAPITLLGGEVFFESILKLILDPKQIHSISLNALCILFIVILLFKSGFIYELIGDIPNSRSISYTRMKGNHEMEIKGLFYEVYVPEQDICSAKWLSNVPKDHSSIYADSTASKTVLNAYGMLIIEWENFLYSNATIDADAYIYLRHLNVQGVLRETGTESVRFSNMTMISNQLDHTNRIYSNGDSEIYRSFSND